MVDKLIEQGVQSCRDAKFEEGVKFFDKALKSSPNHLLALSNRARALSRVGRLADALSDFKQLIQLQPANAQFMGDYAVALHLNDKNDEAGLMFDKALALEPQNPYRYSSRAFFKDRIGDTEGALADYDQCITLDPEDAIALNNRGLVEEKLGYKDKANKSFDQSNKLVGYEPKGTSNSIAQGSNVDLQIPNSNDEATTDAPTTRWEVVKSVFTKEGFRDFVKFSAGLIKK
ncbi:MAG: tetratricopeptide repeat protein [Roseivirga sp.]|nr:tetratricopeptide repeat protein [Roseivirga sp.]